jgi:hypothetical protein
LKDIVIIEYDIQGSVKDFAQVMLADMGIQQGRQAATDPLVKRTRRRGHYQLSINYLITMVVLSEVLIILIGKWF